MSFICFACLRPVSCVPNVASFSGLSIQYSLTFICFAQDTGRRQAKQINVRECWIDNPEKLATLGTQDTGRRQAKQINVRECWIDNPEKLATLGTQDTGRRQAKQINACVPNVASFSGLSIQHSLTFICFACLRPVSCVPIVASFSELSIQHSLTFITPLCAKKQLTKKMT
jgi:hypothetical protein